MSLSERIRAAMALSGVSQVELARACGVKPPSVHGWLTGKAKFLRGENLLLAARALKVSQDWLATGKGDMRQPAETAPDFSIYPIDTGDMLTPEVMEWIKLREYLGSDDIAEFTALIRARQERNVKLIEELENHLHPRRTAHQIPEQDEARGKKQSSQSS